MGVHSNSHGLSLWLVTTNLDAFEADFDPMHVKLLLLLLLRDADGDSGGMMRVRLVLPFLHVLHLVAEIELLFHLLWVKLLVFGWAAGTSKRCVSVVVGVGGAIDFFNDGWKS